MPNEIAVYQSRMFKRSFFFFVQLHNSMFFDRYLTSIHNDSDFIFLYGRDNRTHSFLKFSQFFFLEIKKNSLLCLSLFYVGNDLLF